VLLREALDEIAGTQASTLTVTFALVALAQLALSEGDPVGAARALGAADGLRKRAGLLVWPLTRRSESDLLEHAKKEVDQQSFTDAFAAGSVLHHREALALVRDGSRAR
jgi:hypothetical protein